MRCNFKWRSNNNEPDFADEFNNDFGERLLSLYRKEDEVDDVDSVGDVGDEGDEGDCCE